MTELLFRRDAYLTEFDATIIERRTIKDHPAVLLDRTAFYATSGGQPYDTGTLGEAHILDVIEDGADVIHVLDRPLERNSVHGRIDWARRFDHMQQHSGQHVLSAAFETIGAATISFHLGEETCTIDLDASDMTDEQLEIIEQRTNQAIFDNHLVHISECSLQEAASHHLRKLPEVEGLVRIVDIENFDATACCGTHVRSTGEIGCIHIRGLTKRKGSTRIEFLCGWRAVRDYTERDRLLQAQANHLSVGIHDLGESIVRLEEASSTAHKNEQRLRQQLLDMQLADIAASASALNGFQLICQPLPDQDTNGMRYAAQQLLQEPGRIVLLGVTEPSTQVVFASSADKAPHMGNLLKEVLAAFGGRGGGKPNMAQGGGFEADQLDRVLTTAKAQIVTEISQGR